METKIIKHIPQKTENEFKKGTICWMSKTSFFVCLSFATISIILLILYLILDMPHKCGDAILALSTGTLTGTIIAFTFEVINGKKNIKSETKEYNNLLTKINWQYIQLAKFNPNLNELLVNVLVLDTEHNKKAIKNLNNEDRNKIVKGIIQHYENHCENIPNAKKVLKNILLGFIDPLKNLNKLLPLFEQRYSFILSAEERTKLRTLIMDAQSDKEFVDGIYKDAFTITVEPIQRIITKANKVWCYDSFFYKLYMPEIQNKKRKLSKHKK